MKKGSDFVAVAGLVLSLFLFIYLFSGSLVRIDLAPISSDISIFIDDCTEIGVLWNEVFEIDSSGLDVNFEDDAGKPGCDEFLAWKNDSNRVYILGGSYENDTTFENIALFAIGGDYDEFVKNELQAIDDTDMDNQLYFMHNLFVNSTNSASSRTISSESEAHSSFTSTFAVENSSNFSLNALNNVYEALYETNNLEVSSPNTYQIEINEIGWVHTENDSDYLRIIIYKSLLPPGCVQNWTENEDACKSDDTKNIWYNDSNSCGDVTGRPANFSRDCDYMGYGIIGDEGDYDDDGEELDLLIDGDDVNHTYKYDGDEEVEFIDDDDNVRVRFSHDFDDGPLNLREIRIEIQGGSSNIGWIIVDGIDEDKTVWIDKKSSSSAHVCIEDDNINSISSIHARCDRSDEYLVPCPGSNGEYSCTISGGFLEVDGIDHSGVQEVTPTMLNGSNPNNPNCTPNWDCGGWSACVGGTKTRTCTDLNSCGVPNTAEITTDICTVVAPICTPNWDCGGWSPVDCPSDGFQTRTCTDLNSCGTNSGKPAERFDCEEPKNNTFAIVMIIVLSLLIIGTVVVLVILIKKREQMKRREVQRRNVQVIQGQPRFGGSRY